MNLAFLVVGFVVSVLLLTTSTVTNNNSFYNHNYFKDPTYQTLPYFEWLYKVYAPQQAFAQDEEDDEDSSKDKDEEEEDEEGEDTGGKDNEDEESNNSSNVATEEETGAAAIAEPLEQLSDQYLDVTETKQELEEQSQQVLTEEQQVKEQLNDILIAGNWTNPNNPPPEPEQQEPIFNLTNDHTTNQKPQEPRFKNLTNYYHQTLLDPSCNCTNPQIEPPNQSVLPPTVSPPPQGLQQIIINPGSVKSLDSWGEIKDPRYTGFYTVKNTIDNKVDENSFWSQYGKSGFNIELYPEALQNYEVCHAEVVVHNPKGAQSTLTINSNQNYTGILDNTTEKVDFNTCMKNVDEIGMSFDAPKKYTSIGELKLFGKLVNQPPPVPQPQQPVPGTEGNTTKIEIKNSNAIIDIINSTVTFKFDPHSAQATNYNVITIPVPNNNVGATK